MGPAQQTSGNESLDYESGYKVYKKRWFVLIAVFTINLINGLQKSILPIVDIFNEHMGMTLDQYSVMSQISLFLSLAAVLPLARALEHFGLRKMVSVLSRLRLNLDNFRKLNIN